VYTEQQRESCAAALPCTERGIIMKERERHTRTHRERQRDKGLCMQTADSLPHNAIRVHP
jgi:hypothetical protein